MELVLFVYLAGIAENVAAVFFAITIISSICIGCYSFIHTINKDVYKDKYKATYQYKFLLIPLVAGFIAAIIPSEKTMYMMAGGYVAQSVVQSETGDKVVKLVNSKLDEMLADMQRKVESK